MMRQLVLLLLLTLPLSGCLLGPRHEAMETVRSITAGCGAARLAESDPDFNEKLSAEETRRRYGCIRSGMARHREVIAAGTGNTDLLLATLAYQEALYLEIAAGEMRPSQATLQYLDFSAGIQEQVQQRDLQRAMTAMERQARIDAALSAMNQQPAQGPEQIICHRMGHSIYCSAQ